MKQIVSLVIVSCLLLMADALALVKAADGSNPDDICPSEISFTINEEKLKIPYCRNFPLSSPNKDIKQAVIVIHGLERNAYDYYDNVLTLAMDYNNADQNTIILAPQFLLKEDIDNFELENDVLFWSNSGWQQGNKSQLTSDDRESFRISSFTIVDQIIERLARPGKFPNLSQITIVGHSAGGQFVNRYAAGSQVQTNEIPLRYVIANPSSYLYFNGERRIEGTLDQFAVPDASNCHNYNEYKYGLEDLNSYMEAVNIDRIRNQYLTKEVIYLLGSEDNDPNSSSLNTNCRAMLQGKHRLERGSIYFDYLQHYYGSTVLETHTKVIVPDVGHDDFEMFNSESVKPYLFD